MNKIETAAISAIISRIPQIKWKNEVGKLEVRVMDFMTPELLELKIQEYMKTYGHTDRRAGDMLVPDILRGQSVELTIEKKQIRITLKKSRGANETILWPFPEGADLEETLRGITATFNDGSSGDDSSSGRYRSVDDQGRNWKRYID